MNENYYIGKEMQNEGENGDDLMDMISTAETYTVDLALFSRLGLHTFRTKSQDELFVGRFEEGKSWVQIWVTCMPAMFWRFEIYSDESEKTFMIKTGSGSLSDYWTSVKQVMEGMFVPISIN